MKGKEILVRIREDVKNRDCLNHKQLERDRRFLIYLSKTYRNMCPYLEGIHQTLDSWKMGRDKNGQKLESREINIYLASKEGEVELLKESEAHVDMFPVIW